MIVHFSAHISKWELVCKFGVIFHIFIISCLCSRFHIRNQWFFYSVITFSYTKCFVQSYTVDVVFTLSYALMYCKYTWNFPFSRNFQDRKWWPRHRKWRPFGVSWVPLVIKLLLAIREESSNAIPVPEGIIRAPFAFMVCFTISTFPISLFGTSG